MIIHLVRHTTPDIDAGICYGQTDLSLADTFDEERKSVLQRLNDSYDLLYTSPLKRCAQLAHFIKADNRHQDSRLMEYDFGDWEGLPWKDIKGPGADLWMKDFVDQPAPNGESMRTMQLRVLSFWEELMALDCSSIAVVTHSGVQRLIHAHILKTPLSHLFRLQLDFGAVIEVSVNQQRDLHLIRHK